MYVFILITRLPDSVLLLWFEIIYRLPLDLNAKASCQPIDL